MPKNRICHWGPITALSIITALFIISMLTFMVWCPPQDFIGFIHASIFMVWVVNIFHHFFKAIFLGPGHVPFKWKPALRSDEQFLQYCKPCQGFKAPRSHHCKTCKRCVMKMDHHCPWINNCVGHHNHRSFTFFLLFVVIGCSHAVSLMFLSVYHHMVWRNGTMLLRVNTHAPLRMNKVIMLALLFGIGLAIGVTIAVGILLFYQIKSILKNETSIESWIIEKAVSRGRDDGDVFVYPYDLGMFANLKQLISIESLPKTVVILQQNLNEIRSVMTSSRTLLPWQRFVCQMVLFCWNDFVGDGIEWEIFEGCDKYALTVEQIEQKHLKRENTLTFKVTSPYSGSWFPITYGVRVCWNSPWTEEDRLKIQEGDKLNATRIRKYWVYGQLIEKQPLVIENMPLGESAEKKGWVPRCCVEEFLGDGVTILKKKKVL